MPPPPLPAPAFRSAGSDAAERRSAAGAAFRYFDRDMSGFLDVVEFYHALGALGAGVEYEDAVAVFAVVDSNGNGRVSESEFIEHFMANH